MTTSTDYAGLPTKIAKKMRPDISGCWIWIAGRHGNGYGCMRWNGRNQNAHRAIYEVLVGPIPDRLTLDHLCRNRLCVNPAHMEPVTNKVNVLRGLSRSAQNARKTHCKYGHPFVESNTYWCGEGQRQCKICVANRQRERRARLKFDAALTRGTERK